MTTPEPELSDGRLQEIRAACEMGPPIIKAPTIDELEKILQQTDPPRITIQPDGSITAGPPEMRLPVADVYAMVRELQSRRSPKREELFKAIEHGDAEHRTWLKEALDCFFDGRPVPPPRAVKSPSPKREDVIDAERWRALMASQRIRVMGSAGFMFDGDKIAVRESGYMHLGVELWNVHAAPHPSAEFPQDRCRDLLTFYVDQIRALKEQP